MGNILIQSITLWGINNPGLMLFPVILLLVDILYSRKVTIIAALLFLALILVADTYLIPRGILNPTNIEVDLVTKSIFIIGIILTISTIIYSYNLLIGNALNKTIHELKETQAQLIRSEQMAAIGLLAGGIAHEFNNINSIALGTAELLLKKENLDAEIKKGLTRIDSALIRSSDITANLISLSQPGGVTKKAGDLNELVDRVLKLMNVLFKNRGTEVQFHKGVVSPALINDEQLTQVILNIITNAEHAMTECAEKKLTIETCQRGKYLALIISDTGCGIPSELQQDIFKPFYSTKSKDGYELTPDTSISSGLGLSITLSIVKEHGGSIEVESVVGEGTTFVISLPSAPAGMILSDEQAKQEAAAVKASNNKKSLKILVIDDEKEIRAIIKESLEIHNHQVVTTDDGRVALKLLQNDIYDLVLLDLHMPLMDGSEFLKLAVDLPATHRAPCIVVTGKPTENLRHSVGKELVKTIIHKPFTQKMLISSVEREFGF
jgi:signal transduction histidine kinase/CheY-like chemotaxis protein